jgi:excisionase family DNA binding protein
MSLLTTKEVAEQLKLSVSSISRMVAKNTIPYLRISGSIRFKMESIETWLCEMETSPAYVQQKSSRNSETSAETPTGGGKHEQRARRN